MQTIAPIPAFDFDEDRFDYGDVVLASIGWGEWQALEASLGDGLARVARAEREGRVPDEEGIGAAIVSYRRARGLLAGEEYLAWLAERSLSTSDVSAHLWRGALRDRAAADDGADADGREPSGEQPSGAELAGALRAEAILGGSLQSWAARLARCAAAARALAAEGQSPAAEPRESEALVEAAAAVPLSGLSPAGASERAGRVAPLLAAERRFRERASTRERLERCVAEHHLEWQRMVWREALFGSEGAAREAAMLMTQDGMALEEAAALARAETSTREAYLEEMPELSPRMLAAMPGDVLGPLAHEHGWQLLSLLERVAPSLQDAELRERAGAEVLERALERHLTGRVRWHGRH